MKIFRIDLADIDLAAATCTQGLGIRPLPSLIVVFAWYGWEKGEMKQTQCPDCGRFEVHRVAFRKDSATGEPVNKSMPYLNAVYNLMYNID